ncbi:hypothetical protein JVX98_02470 (plasmid) [Ensifer sp. PDNC004]|uniref:hypothetical protein n=1 Tax=Ensifer sp. PDNC004 TaxID=2811423 RepID=UPI001962E281|nr:hypothetical protein [Ensifer sp. PDNC004]QRY65976.1 hypothetical protein JVX98_02470 [Ensifer sp. PDNC004]
MIDVEAKAGAERDLLFARHRQAIAARTTVLWRVYLAEEYFPGSIAISPMRPVTAQFMRIRGEDCQYGPMLLLRTSENRRSCHFSFRGQVSEGRIGHKRRPASRPPPATVSGRH